MNQVKKKQTPKKKNPGKLIKKNMKDAWYTAFFLENHMDHSAYPSKVAAPEQVGFMVYLEENEKYYPCSDHMFNAIMSRKDSKFLQEKYNEVLQKIFKIVDEQITNKKEKKYLKDLIKIKFDHETRDEIIIPSRLEKRLIKIFINRTHISDPYYNLKAERNKRADAVLHSKPFINALVHVDLSKVKIPETLSEIKDYLDYVELRRFISLTGETCLWEINGGKYTKKDFLNCFNRPLTGNGVKDFFDFIGLKKRGKYNKPIEKKKILWLANEAGEIMVDIAIIKYLTRLGHKIIISFKKSSLYTKTDIFDAHEDEILSKQLKKSLLIKENNLSKNKLVEILKLDNDILHITDGGRETINLLLTSTSFARIFKEVDGVVSRGVEQRRRFFNTHFQFTQDIYNISTGEGRSIDIIFKPKHPSVIKFSHKDLEIIAQSIINEMAEAKKHCMTVIFYSGIIGSIPGKIDMAKKIMTVFIAFLKKQFAQTYIINPSTYYQPGMDADDLMYMWEIIQTSGLIDIWRFQSYNDIVKAFNIMKKRVPPEWVGKDATFSTGCTKEMRIALRVQMTNPEMKVIGPSKEQFIRRNEYGVGKMFDERLSNL